MLSKKFILNMAMVVTMLITANNVSAIEESSGFYFKGFGQGSKIFKNKIEYNGDGVLGIYNHYNIKGMELQPTAELEYSPEYKKAFGGGVGIGYDQGIFSSDLEVIISNRQEIKPDGYMDIDSDGKESDALNINTESSSAGEDSLSENANYIYAYTKRGNVKYFKNGEEENVHWSKAWEEANMIYQNKGFSYFAGALNAYLSPSIGSFKPYIGVGVGLAKLRYSENLQSKNLLLQGKVGVAARFGSFEPYIGYKIMELKPKKEMLELQTLGAALYGGGKNRIDPEHRTNGLHVKQTHFIHNIEAGLKISV